MKKVIVTGAHQWLRGGSSLAGDGRRCRSRSTIAGGTFAKTPPAPSVKKTSSKQVGENLDMVLVER